MFDINALAAPETAFMQLRDVHGNPVVDDKNKPVGITFYTTGSRAHQDAQDEYNQWFMDNRQTSPSAKQLRERNDLYLAKRTRSFDGFPYEADGKSGVDLFLAFWSDPKFVIVRKQADEWLGEDKNFLIGSPTS